jgi:hypothetical protein
VNPPDGTSSNLINIIVIKQISNFNTLTSVLFQMRTCFGLHVDGNWLKIALKERITVGVKSWSCHLLSLMTRFQISIAQGEA